MKLTDTHCHLDLDRFQPDLQAVLERAAQAGVVQILVPGLNLASSRRVVDLAAQHANLFAAMGVHPTERAQPSPADWEELRTLALLPKVRAIGEIGLDYYWDTLPHHQQHSRLEVQLTLAQELNLPVVLHLREKKDASTGPCAQDLLAILKQWIAGLRQHQHPLAERPGVLHSFSGSPESAVQALEMGFYLGVTGPVTTHPERQALVAGLPLASLLLETDAPFLSPAPLRGRRNEPANVALIADKIAALHHCTLEEVAAITTTNAMRLFAWDGLL